MRWSSCIVLAALMAGVTVAAADPCEEPRPDWCQAGYSCLRSECATEATLQLIDLQEQLRHLKIRARRFHADLACGPGLASALDKDFGAQLFPTPGACVIGIALRLGH